MFCQKRCSQRFRKFRSKTPVLKSFFNKVACLAPILKNICKRLLLHCTCTTHLFSIFFLIIAATTVNISHICFCFKEFKSGISFSWKSLSLLLFLFPCHFYLSQFCFIFVVAAHEKNSFKLIVG